VPKLEPFDSKASKALCENFMKTILRTLDDFTDMKLSVGLVNDVKRESDVYFKLITKDVLLMIQLKVIRELSNKPIALI
jgi:hypothetical protein